MALDAILDVVSRQFPAAGVDCLLIGGFAVNHYGYTRNTLDMDFMIAADQQDTVTATMRQAGFTDIAAHENVVFLQLPNSSMRVDFLLVDTNTLRRLLVSATTATVHGHLLKVPSLRDLIALKVFSLSQNVARRMGKDLPDIAFLAVINGLDMQTDIRPLCDRFGAPQVYELIRGQVETLRRI
jgi:hypothetical protein